MGNKVPEKEETKDKKVTIRVTKSLRESVLQAIRGTQFQDINFQQVLIMLVRLGLQAEQMSSRDGVPWDGITERRTKERRTG